MKTVIIIYNHRQMNIPNLRYFGNVKFERPCIYLKVNLVPVPIQQ